MEVLKNKSGQSDPSQIRQFYQANMRRAAPALAHRSRAPALAPSKQPRVWGIVVADRRAERNCIGL